jgi:8-oxo-dGTP pyrophosphatase MutT (NUDIX family)
MKFDQQFPRLLSEELKKPLPGEDAQYMMAPSYRPHLTKEEIMAYNPRLGGVLLLLYVKNGEFNIVFTKRLEYNGVHSAQMSFPGGKKEARDENLTQTALRETYEEVGVAPEKIEILGRLTELFIPPSNFLITPSVGFATGIDIFTPQQSEVAEIVEIPVSFFLDEKNVNPKTPITLPGNHFVEVPAYIFNEHIIWGATAIVLSEFVAILKRLVRN